MSKKLKFDKLYQYEIDLPKHILQIGNEKTQ